MQIREKAAVGLIMLAGAAGAAIGSGNAAAAGAAPTAVTYEVTAEMLESGKKVYQRNCAPCRGDAGRGDGPSSANLRPRPRDHSNAEYMDRLSDQRIAETVRRGGVISGYPMMPSSPHIQGADLVALVAFVRTLSHPAEEVDTVELEVESQASLH